MSGSRRSATLIEPSVRGAVEAVGYDLEDLTVARAGRRDVVRVVVDRDGGVDLDDIADVSRAVSQALDETDDGFGVEPYMLEVTSPGVDRPLTENRHWRRNIGRLVKVAVSGESGAGVADTGKKAGDAKKSGSGKPGSGKPGTGKADARANTLTGRILSVDEAGVRLDVDGKTVEYRYDQLGPGRVQIEFSRANARREDVEDAGKESE